MLHIPSLITFSTINSISVSVNNSNFTSAFLKTACHANSRAERSFPGSNLSIFKHIFLKFPNNDICQNVLFQNLYKLFLHTCNLHL